jgi:uncharacterized RDD family membrane protein YckC
MFKYLLRSSFAMPSISKKKKESYPQPKMAEVTASIWKRIGAFVIDMIIVYIIVLFALGDKIMPAINDASSFAQTYAAMAESTGIADGVSFIFSTLMLMYYMMLERKFGQSVGKMVVNIYVVPMVPDRKEVSSLQNLGRSMFLIPFGPFMLLWFIDPISMFFTKDNQRLSEMLTKTKVIERKQIVPMDDVVV